MPGGVPKVPTNVVVSKDPAGMRITWKCDDLSTTGFFVELAGPLPPERRTPIALTQQGELGKEARSFVDRGPYRPSNEYSVCATDTDSMSADQHRASCSDPLRIDQHLLGKKPAWLPSKKAAVVAPAPKP